MSELILSRRDVDFLLQEWLATGRLTSRPQFAEHDQYSCASTLDVYELMAKQYFAPHNKLNDSREPQFDGTEVRLNAEVGIALSHFSDAGLMAAGMPVDKGGMGLPSVVERAGMAFLLAANIGTAAYAVLTIANANLLLTYGTAGQVRRYVDAMLSGHAFGTMCLSEPQAGSSLSDIRTRAVPDADGRYRLFGNKMWISGGEHSITGNIVHLVLAKIPDATGKVPAGVKGISLFVVPKYLVGEDGGRGERNDIALAGINHKMGYRGTVNCLLNFGEGQFKPEGAGGAIGELVGEPGKGLAYMFHMMNEARISVGLGAAALAYTGYLHALDYARERRQGRTKASGAGGDQVPIVGHADVRRMLLAQKAYAQGSLALCLYAAMLSDELHSQPDESARREAGLLLDLLTPVVKTWPSQWGLAANDLAIQVHGGYGYTREYNVEQFYRDNRLNAIHEGTTGIQALDLLGRKVDAEQGCALRLLDARVEATCRLASTVETLAGHARSLGDHWHRVRSVTESLAALAGADERLANASAYLDAFGHVVVGWLWLDQAVTAATAAEACQSSAELSFYRGKRAACDYYFGWELGKVPGMLAVLDPVERTPLDADEDWL
ncbi:MAG: hypothetical protein RIR41_1796 [Pseudomonadota bacterium]|jgi:alkylation response protein AidB-like acyl-CoA dehydrogenase